MRHHLFALAMALVGCSNSSPTARSDAPAPVEAATGAAKAVEKEVAPPAAAEPYTWLPGDGKFSVRPPLAKPPEVKEMPDPNGGSWRQFGWTTRDGVFAVLGRTYRSPAEATAETEMFIPTRTKSDITIDRMITVSGHPAREVAWNTNGFTIHARFVIVGATVFKINVGGRRMPEGAAAFLDSFTLRSLDLDAATIAEGKIFEGPTTGPADAPVTVVIFQGAVCPFSTNALAAIAPVLKSNPGQVRVVFKQMPMPNHLNSDLASEAMLAAHAQGKFEALHAQLVTHPTALAREDLIKYATKAKLDVERFTTELDAHTHAAAVQADLALAKRMYVLGTPTMFINGKRISDAKPAAFAAALDAAMKSPGNPG